MGKFSRDKGREYRARYRASGKGKLTDLRRLDRLAEVTKARRESNLWGSSECEWRVVPGFPDYEVSEYGDVRRATPARTRRVGHILKSFPSRDGYRKFKIVVSGKKVDVSAHRLVALAFIGSQPSPAHQVAHGDGTRTNNHYTNLRWALPAENCQDRVRHGTSPVGRKNPRAKVTESDVREIRRLYQFVRGQYGEVGRLRAQYGLGRSAFRSLVNGGNWSHVR